MIHQFKTGLVVGFNLTIDGCVVFLDLIQIQLLNSTHPNFATSLVWNALDHVVILGIVPGIKPILLGEIKLIPAPTPVPTKIPDSTQNSNSTNSTKMANPDVLLGELDKMIEKVRTFRKECETTYRMFFLTRPRCKVCYLQVISCDSFCDSCYMYVKNKTDLCLSCLKPGRGGVFHCLKCEPKQDELFENGDGKLYRRMGDGFFGCNGEFWRPTIYEYKSFVRVEGKKEESRGGKEKTVEIVLNNVFDQDASNKMLYYLALSR